MIAGRDVVPSTASGPAIGVRYRGRMVEVRSGEASATRPPPATEIEWVHGGSGHSGGRIDRPHERGATARFRWLVVGSSLVLASLAVVAGLESTELADAPASSTTEVPRAAPAPAPAVVAPTTTEAVPALDPAPLALVQDRLVAWVDDDRSLVLNDLETGSRIEVEASAAFSWPPIPERVRLLGADSSTYVVDPERPERSGPMAASVRMVRFGVDTDQYAYVSTNERGGSDFFAGSIWGPSNKGVSSTDASTRVLTVADRGVVLSTADGVTSTLTGFGFEELPPEVGSVVAASRDLLAAIRCAGVACAGLVTDWDATEFQPVPLDVVAREIVRISPDNRYVLGAGGEEWVVYDLVTGDTVVEVGAVAPDHTVAWTDDSAALVWVDRDRIVIDDLADGSGPMVAVDGLDPALVPAAGSEVLVVELP